MPDGLHSVDDLWDPALAGRVEVLSEMRDTVGLIMLSQGVDVSGDWGDDEFNAALDVLDQQIKSGQIRQVKGNSYAEDLVSGDALAVIGWSGDITVLNFENGANWEFALPDAGRHAVERQPDDPDRQPAQVERRGADQLLLRPGGRRRRSPRTSTTSARSRVPSRPWRPIDPTLVDNPLIFPDDATLAKSHVFRALTADEETKYNKAFQTVIGN